MDSARDGEARRWIQAWSIRHRPRAYRGSDRDELAVLPERHPQPVADLAHRRVGVDRFNECGHDVLAAARAVAEPRKRLLPGPRITLRAHARDSLDLAPLPFRIDPLDHRPHVAPGCVLEAVPPDDDPVARLDLLLRPVGRLL